MNVGRYLRGEDRHVGTARTTQPQPPQRTEQEPWCMKMNGCKTKCEDCPDEPPQRTEQPQQKKVWTFWDLSGGDITDAIKAKLKEKNK
jgi:hypothetical protein